MFKKLTKKVIGIAKEAVKEETVKEVKNHLPVIVGTFSICLGVYTYTQIIKKPTRSVTTVVINSICIYSVEVAK